MLYAIGNYVLGRRPKLSRRCRLCVYFLSARRSANSVSMVLCLSVTNRNSIETSGRIELVSARRDFYAKTNFRCIIAESVARKCLFMPSIRSCSASWSRYLELTHASWKLERITMAPRWRMDVVFTFSCLRGHEQSRPSDWVKTQERQMTDRSYARSVVFNKSSIADRLHCL